MPLTYNATTIGTITIAQEIEGKEQKFTLQIRQGNCLAVIVYIRKATEKELERHPNGKYIHTLWSFYGDEQHMKNIIKNEGDIFFHEKVVSIKLNLYYKECKTLLKYYTLSGHKVTCYYKEPKKK